MERGVEWFRQLAIAWLAAGYLRDIGNLILVGGVFFKVIQEG